MFVPEPGQTLDAAAVSVLFAGAGFTIIVLVLDAAPHGPVGSLVVSVNVTVPEKLAAGV